MHVTLTRDTTFLIADELGNVPGTEFGLYREDTRFLSRYDLFLDGRPAVSLATQALNHTAASHFLTNPSLPKVPRDALSIVRRRIVDQGLHEDLDITSYGDREAAFALDLCVDADFAHIFDVKHASQDDEETAQRRGKRSAQARDDRRGLRIHYQHGEFRRTLQVQLSHPAQIERGRCRFPLRLAPRECWHLCLHFALLAGDETAPAPPATHACGTFHGREAPRKKGDIGGEMLKQAPALAIDSSVLQEAYQQSLRDIAMLRISREDLGEEEFALAAGFPWYMALFGRDAMITAYQVLPFCPDVAKGVLRVLARLQGRRVDRHSAEEPGKIIHEHRFGYHPAAEQYIPTFPYYGAVDTTPLFLMLLAAVHRVTGDTAFVRSLRENAERALEWMVRHGDRDGDGYLEYQPHAEVGLENQGWKDSRDAIRFRDGHVAKPPVALCEAQGYAYAARLGMAEVFDAIGEPNGAARLRAEAQKLKRRFNHDFWLPERNYYALALDGDKRPVDSITSNPGHLLWAGIADAAKARRVAQRLLAPELFSGWGVRTMATTEGGYNPISYHNGSVWPHDTSLILAGLMRYGLVKQATRMADGLLAALQQRPDRRLPELFCGYSRDELPSPVDYPAANRPQAWASGAILLALAAMPGADPEAIGLRETPFLPTRVQRLRIDGLWVGQRPVRVELVRTERGLTRTVHG